jgi:hypothetical protein
LRRSGARRIVIERFDLDFQSFKILSSSSVDKSGSSLKDELERSGR